MILNQYKWDFAMVFATLTYKHTQLKRKKKEIILWNWKWEINCTHKCTHEKHNYTHIISVHKKRKRKSSMWRTQKNIFSFQIFFSHIKEVKEKNRVFVKSRRYSIISLNCRIIQRRIAEKITKTKKKKHSIMRYR